jgi:hypothetical protein
MIEVLAILGGVVVLYIGYTFVRFSSFKSRLMNEFERRGVSFSTADEVYFRLGDFINSMHANGASTDKIVDEVMERYPELF